MRGTIRKIVEKSYQNPTGDPSEITDIADNRKIVEKSYKNLQGGLVKSQTSQTIGTS